jgi:hypothetical protein
MGEDPKLEVRGHVVTLHEACAQPYQNCVFSAGLASGHPVDTMYLQLKRDGEPEPLTLLLRPDEAMAIYWALSGALWTHEMRRMDDTKPAEQT